MGFQIASTKDAGMRGINIIVYGVAGAGKTTLLGTTGDPQGTLILSAEAGLLPLRHLDLRVVEIDTIQTLREVLAWLRRGDHDVRWVCVDSLSEIAERVLAHERKRVKDPRMAYGEMADVILQATKDLRDLHVNTVLVAKHERAEDDGRAYSRLLLPGRKLPEVLPYEVDVVAELRVARGEDNQVVRWLQTEADGRGVAKDRSGTLAAQEEPNLAAMAAKILHGAAAPPAPAQVQPSPGPVPTAPPANGPAYRITKACDAVADLDPNAVARLDQIINQHAGGTPLEAVNDEVANAILSDLRRLYAEIKQRAA